MKKIIFLLHAFILFLSSFAEAQTNYYSIASGNWNSNATWSTTGCAGAAAAAYPVAGDNVTICGTRTVTLTQNESCQNLTIVSTGVITAVAGASYTLTVSNNCDVQSGGSINLNGKGSAGGIGATSTPAAGTGPGATSANSSGVGAGGGAHGGNGGVGGDGSVPYVYAAGGTAYGSLTNPVALGSGGGYADWTNADGGAGGGAIKLAVTNLLTVNGSITANGNTGVSNTSGGGGGGGGGSIWLDAGTITGTTGTITANGGNAGGGPGLTDLDAGGGGGGGRIALYYTTNTFSGTINSTGGNGALDNNTLYKAAGAGTIYDPQATNTLRITGDNTNNCHLTPVDLSLAITYNTIYVSNKANAYFSGAVQNSTISNITISNGTVTQAVTPLTIGANILITSNGVFTSAAGTAVVLNVNNNITIDAGSSINLNGKGFAGGIGASSTPAAGPGPGATSANSSGLGGGGGAHGGNGGAGGDGSAPFVYAYGGTAYGSLTTPVSLGSGGGYADWTDANGGAGGGAIKVVVTNTLTINGSINANGTTGISNTNGGGGGGSGGSLWIDAGTITGNGSITANGGDGGGGSTLADADAGGGGAGGRIALYYTVSTFQGTKGKIYAAGGRGYTSFPFGMGKYQTSGGGAGTIYLKKASAANPTLLISNYTGSAINKIAAYTPFDATPAVQYDTLWIKKGTRMLPYGVQSSVFPQIRIDTAGYLALSSGYTFTCTNDIIVTGRSADTSRIVGRDSSTAQAVLNVSDQLNINIYSQVNFNGMGSAATLGTGAGANSVSAAGVGAGGAAHGGNGGIGGDGSVPYVYAAAGTAYGSFTNPVTVGSGGGNQPWSGAGGGSGAGAIALVITNTLTNNGAISANGIAGTSNTNGGGGGGAGGSIKIQTGTLTGAGTISANGGNGGGALALSDLDAGGAGGGGRISLSYTTNTFTGAITAYGGEGALDNNTQYKDGGAGTIYDPNITNELRIINNGGVAPGRIGHYTPVDISQVFTFNNLYVAHGANFNPYNAQVSVINNLILDRTGTNVGGWMTPTTYSVVVDNNITVSAYSNITSNDSLFLGVKGGSMTIAANGTANFNGKGYGATLGPGAGANSISSAGVGAGGGAYGGNGGQGGPDAAPALGGIAYQSASQPMKFGSGGGNQPWSGATGGKGGGKFKLYVDVTLTVNGSITSDGTAGATNTNGGGGGGAGGAIWICAPTIAGSGTIRAGGGNGGGALTLADADAGGGGGGGRIALYYNTLTLPGANITSPAGPGNSTITPASDQSQPGTIFQDVYGNCPGAPLPIELLSFSGSCKAPSNSPQGGEIILQWSTASELNNDYFTVERSNSLPSGGLGWASIGTVKGAGNSSTIQQYEFTYESPSLWEGKGWAFRLKQTDYDGKYEYFGPIMVRFPCSENEMEIFPNPSSGIFTIVHVQEGAEMRVYNLLGEKVYSEKILNSKSLILNLDVPSGIYFVMVNTPYKQFIQKIIINK